MVILLFGLDYGYRFLIESSFHHNVNVRVIGSTVQCDVFHYTDQNGNNKQNKRDRETWTNEFCIAFNNVKHSLFN